MLLSELENKKILILGLGREGLATLSFLQKELKNPNLAVADQRVLTDFPAEIQSELTDFTKHLGESYLKNLEDYEIIIKSPGIYPRKTEIQSAMAAGVQVTSATNIFFANCKGKVIGVTGSKGKSTVSSLIYQVLLEANLPVLLLGNIGEAALNNLGQDSADKLYIFELSSYQLEDLKYSADIAVVTSLFPEHLDYHGDFGSYVQAKMNIAKNLKEENTLIYNAASKELTEFVKGLTCQKIAFNDNKTSKFDDEKLYQAGEAIMSVSEVPLLGQHNLENVLAVCAVAKLLDIEKEIIQSAVSKFKSLSHRLEFVGTYQEIDFYDDAISTTPESTIAAIRAMKKPIGTLILGGLDRGYDFSTLAQEIIDQKVNNIVLFPDSGQKIWQALSALQGNLPAKYEVDDMPSCVKKCFEITLKGTICLLSTASPSYSIFKNFEDKGEKFQREVTRNS